LEGRHHPGRGTTTWLHVAPALLTELAIEGQAALAKEILTDPPTDAFLAILSMAERYWFFMLENKHLYRLMNVMDGASTTLGA
jgi:hypothetical protein